MRQIFCLCFLFAISCRLLGSCVSTRPVSKLHRQDAGCSSDCTLRSLQAMLFHVAFWRLDLSYFGRGLLHGWPQRDAGIVLWSLSVAANDWQPRERLSRLCTVPVIGVLEQKWDIASYAQEAHILRPLL